MQTNEIINNIYARIPRSLCIDSFFSIFFGNEFQCGNAHIIIIIIIIIIIKETNAQTLVWLLQIDW